MNNKIDVTYYAVNAGSELEGKLKTYEGEVSTFCTTAEHLIKNLGAAGIVLSHTFNGYVIDSYFFKEDNAPIFGWKRDHMMGSYNRKSKNPLSVAYGLGDARLDYLSDCISLPIRTRMGKFGETYVLAIPDNNTVASYELKDAKKLGVEEFEALKTAHPDDAPYCILDDRTWMPALMQKSAAFNTPKEILAEARANKSSLRDTFAETLPGQLVRWVARKAKAAGFEPPAI